MRDSYKNMDQENKQKVLDTILCVLILVFGSMGFYWGNEFYGWKFAVGYILVLGGIFTGIAWYSINKWD